MLIYRYLEGVVLPSDTVLDVGAGNARLLSALPCRTVALDIVHTPAAATQEAVLGDGCLLPFKTDSFDYVVSNQVLEHVRQKAAYVSELSRVLKPSGELFIAFPNRYWLFDEHHTVPGLSLLPRAVGVPLSKHLLSEHRHVYYRNHLHPVSPIRARLLLGDHFETVEYVTVDLIRELDLHGTAWERPKRLLPLGQMRSRPVETLFELCATYLAYRCTGPRDRTVSEDENRTRQRALVRTLPLSALIQKRASSSSRSSSTVSSFIDKRTRRW